MHSLESQSSRRRCPDAIPVLDKSAFQTHKWERVSRHTKDLSSFGSISATGETVLVAFFVLETI